MASELIHALTTQTFDEGIKEGIVFVDFWATWCPPCRALAPILDQLAEEYKDKVAIRKVDVDNEQALAARFGVVNIPTMLLFQNGKQVEKLVGLRSKDDLADLFDGYIGA